MGNPILPHVVECDDPNTRAKFVRLSIEGVSGAYMEFFEVQVRIKDTDSGML